MPKNKEENKANLEDVLFHPRHQKHLSILHGKTNCYRAR